MTEVVVPTRTIPAKVNWRGHAGKKVHEKRCKAKSKVRYPVVEIKVGLEIEAYHSVRGQHLEFLEGFAFSVFLVNKRLGRTKQERIIE